MATTEEKTELVETLKGPRFYRIRLYGYGGESAYINVSKEVHDFWQPICEEHGDSDLVNYMVNDDPEDYDFDNIEVVPPEADFLTEEDYKYQWYEAPNEIVHQYGVEHGSARVNIEEVSSDDYNADVVAEVVDGENLQEYLKADGWDFSDIDEISEEGDYMLHMMSSEKGTFFEGRFETIGEFDPKKLKVIITEYPNGEDTVTSILYNDVDVENDGGDTNGKGYYAAVWKNVQ